MVQHRVGLSPSSSEVHDWFYKLGYNHSVVVGQTVMGRNLTVYTSPPNNHKGTFAKKTILLVSLVHGNEPHGLLSLIETSYLLLVEKVKGKQLFESVVFFPIVNLDAYEANRDFPNGGCRRKNFRRTCHNNNNNNILHKLPFLKSLFSKKSSSSSSFSCNQDPTDMEGVDLNRNFPLDWDNSQDGCLLNFAGDHPFSEPETQAIRTTLERFPHLNAYLSFHGRANPGSPPLAIHPYASHRLPEQFMDHLRLQWYRNVTAYMEQEYHHQHHHHQPQQEPLESPFGTWSFGTARETIFYTAGGTAMDWMHSQGLTPLVLEVQSPCMDRWCLYLPPEQVTQYVQDAAYMALSFLRYMTLHQPPNFGNDTMPIGAFPYNKASSSLQTGLSKDYIRSGITIEASPSMWNDNFPVYLLLAFWVVLCSLRFRKVVRKRRSRREN